MRNAAAGVLSGLLAGCALSAAMSSGRHRCLPHQTGEAREPDWIDAGTAACRDYGPFRGRFVEQVNHLIASAIFGAVYGLVRGWWPHRQPSLGAGVLFGSGLYALNAVGILPKMAPPRSRGQEPPSTMAQFTTHILFGLIVERALSLLQARSRAVR